MDKFKLKIKSNFKRVEKYLKTNFPLDYYKNIKSKCTQLTPVRIKKEFLENLGKINIRNITEKVQDKIEQSVRRKNDDLSLNQSSFWAKGITWLIIGGTGFGVAWLAIAKTDEIVIAPGELEPVGGVVEIQMPVNGITKNVLVQEGQKVSKGDVLIELDNEVTNAQISAIKESLLLNNEILDNLETLVEEGAVSKVQYLQQKNKVINLQREEAENQITQKYQIISSPVDGYVFDLQPSGRGYVARSSEPVLKIVPTNKLYAKIEIPSRSIGFVSVGKKVDISIESYPASDFGVIEGKISKIGSDALQPDRSVGKGYRFPADIQLNTQTLNLVNGNKLPLQVGMSLTANIKLRKVSYMQILLNTFNEKSNSLRSL